MQDVHVKALSHLDEKFEDETLDHLVYLQQQQLETGSQFPKALASNGELWAQALMHVEVGLQVLPGLALPSRLC